MTDITPDFQNPLVGAISQLRSICQGPQQMTSATDCGSVARITAHVTNINASVVESTRDHANASKRLNDFATTLTRMARDTAQGDNLASRMHLVAASLRSASAKLADSCKKTPEGPAPTQAG